MCIIHNLPFYVPLKALLSSYQLIEKTGDHLFRSTSCTTNICWIWLVLKHSYSTLLFTFPLIGIEPLFFTFYIKSYKCVLQYPFYIFWTFVCTSRHEHLFQLLSNYMESNENKPFHTKMITCNIVCMVVELIIKTYISSFCTASKFSDTKTDFRQPSRLSLRSQRQSRLNTLYQRFRMAKDRRHLQNSK